MKQGKKRVIVSWLLMLVMIFSVVVIPGRVVNAENETFFEFTNGGVLDSEHNCVNYTVDGNTVSVQVGLRSAPNDEGYPFEALNIIDKGEHIEAAFTDQSGQLSGYFLRITNSSSSAISVYVNGSIMAFEDDSTEWISLANMVSYNAGGAPIMVEVSSGGGSNSSADYENIEVDVTFNNTQGDVKINDVRTTEGASYKGTLTKAGYTESSKTNTIAISTSFGEAPAKSITINGKNYTIDSTNTNDDISTFEVPGASKYTIVVEGDTSAVVPRTIIWTNPDYVPADEEDAEWASHFSIGHGYAKAIAVYNESGKQLDPKDYVNEYGDENGLSNGFGWVSIYPGYRVVFEFTPEYGYQLTGITLNDSPIAASANMNQFEFKMPEASGNVQFGATFTKIEDVVKSNTSKVSNGSISIGNEELDAGTARLSVSDITLSASQVSNFANAATGYNIASYLDIDLAQVFYKGKSDENDVWSNEIKDLKNEATITLTLADGVNGDEIVLVHEKHDGTYEIIPTTYDAASHTITFKTSSFSNYAIASKAVPASKGSSVESKDSSDTSNYVVSNSDKNNPEVTYTGDDNKSKTSVTIPDTVTDAYGVTYMVSKIANNALKNNKSVKSVTIGNNIKEIGSGAFQNATKLATVKLGKNVEKIGNNAFSGCKKLKTIAIGSKVTTIGNNAFAKCTSLSKITIPTATTSIGKMAFNGDKKLKTITIKSKKLTTKTVAKNAFKGVSAKTTIKVPKSKKKAYTTLFRKKGLSKKVKIK